MHLSWRLRSILCFIAIAMDATGFAQTTPETIVKTPPVRRVCILETKRCYVTLAEATARVRNGQTIELEPGVYRKDTAFLRAHQVTIRVKNGGRAILDPEGRHAFGKGTLVIQGNENVVEGLTFRNAKVPHRNGAGIRFEGGDLTIRNCRFEGNEMGLLTGDHPTGHVQIIDSVFADSERVEDVDTPINGYPAHNIYIGHTDKLTLRGVWSHSARIGHALKSRARNNDIEASYFSSRLSTGSYEAEFPSGGNVRFVGNIVEQGKDSDNRRMLAIGFEFWRYPNNLQTHTIEIAQNTFVNHNLFWGEMVVVRAAASFAPTVTMSGNVWVGPGSPNGAGNLSVSRSHLISVDACDFRVRPDKTAENVDFVPTAQFEYVHPAMHRPRSTRNVGALSADNATLTPCT